MLPAAATLVRGLAACLPIESFVTTKVLVRLASPASSLPRMRRGHRDIIQHIYHSVHAELWLCILLLHALPGLQHIRQGAIHVGVPGPVCRPASDAGDSPTSMSLRFSPSHGSRMMLEAPAKSENVILAVSRPLFRRELDSCRRRIPLNRHTHFVLSNGQL